MPMTYVGSPPFAYDAIVETVRESSRQFCELRRQLPPVTQVHVFGSSEALQFGAPSVARTRARAFVPARYASSADAATPNATSVGVPPRGVVPCMSAMSAGT